MGQTVNSEMNRIGKMGMPHVILGKTGSGSSEMQRMKIGRVRTRGKIGDIMIGSKINGKRIQIRVATTGKTRKTGSKRVGGKSSGMKRNMKAVRIGRTRVGKTRNGIMTEAKNGKITVGKTKTGKINPQTALLIHKCPMQQLL